MATKPPALPTLSDDEIGVMGLTEIEPSPVDETPAEFQEGYFPSNLDNGVENAQEEFELPRRTTTTLGLGGSHGPVWWCMFSFFRIPTFTYHIIEGR